MHERKPRHFETMRDPSGVWVYRALHTPLGMHAWWRWIRLWPLPVVIRKRPAIMREH